MGESRQELLGWLNSLLQLNITKVEQCGTGAPLCQIFDSIFLDVPMTKVKFNVNAEYAYIQNFKVLQNCFTKHQIERQIPVTSLIKCKMQDNLEFLQWTKRYWDQYFPGLEYDAVARRKASGTSLSAGPSSLGSSTRTAPSTAAPAARRPMAASNVGAARAPRTGSAASGGGPAAAALKAKNDELMDSVAGLERERDFYFNKLREIEVMLQAEVEAKPELENDTEGIIARCQAILYSTEEGFEIPEGEGEEAVAGGDGGAHSGAKDGAEEEETF